MSGVLVIAEHRRGKLRPVTGELIGAGVSLTAAIGGPLTVLVVGPHGTDVAAEVAAGVSVAGVERVLVVASGPEHFDAATCAAIAAQVAGDEQPRAILVGHTVDGMGLGAALAAGLGAGLAADVFALSVDDGEIIATRGGYGGKVALDIEFPPGRPIVLCLRGASFGPALGKGSAEIVTIEASPDDAPVPSRHIEYRDTPAAGLDLAKSEFVIAVGRGIGDAAHLARFQALAEKLGASLACSRPVADAGWLPKSHQIGQSGAVAEACKLYLALGISGAVQHLAGMKHVETVIAVNTDGAAPIFGHATHGICMDLFEFTDALENLLASDPAAFGRG